MKRRTSTPESRIPSDPQVRPLAQLARPESDTAAGTDPPSSSRRRPRSTAAALALLVPAGHATAAPVREPGPGATAPVREVLATLPVREEKRAAMKVRSPFSGAAPG
ncbi:hypothetical protein GCM10010358_66120 [Streptomyces minutiscleroticus]|uniref:Uncharacterized protein n=1 Tax=Streptomyces minutiscleroticus TaxID=68238 RepID=A0A918U6J4_9ACTN|nr:hypothetical protein GCM10010358_66120 [Streptomyces minutiscleroticus]